MMVTLRVLQGSPPVLTAESLVSLESVLNFLVSESLKGGVHLRSVCCTLGRATVCTGTRAQVGVAAASPVVQTEGVWEASQRPR